MRECLYANHAAISPWPLRSSRVVEQFALENAQHGAAHYPRWLEQVRELRQRASRIIDAGDADNIALLPNTTSGINLVAAGLPWQPGDNMVLPRDEFPSNRMPWEALAARGVELRTCDIRASAEPEMDLLNLIDDKTRLLALSSVQWTDGLRLDLERLGRACRHHQVLFFVDAIQQLGALQLSVEREHIDILCAGCHKWQMAPEGVALFYCNATVREQIEPLMLGWRMVEDPFDFDALKQRPSATATRYEPGTSNIMGQLALNASLALFEQIGMDCVEQRVLANSRQLAAGLQSIQGLELRSRSEPQRQSGIVSFKPRHSSSREISNFLAAQGIVATHRGPLVRLSPHYYQGEMEMDVMLDAIESVANKK